MNWSDKCTIVTNFSDYYEENYYNSEITLEPDFPIEKAFNLYLKKEIGDLFNFNTKNKKELLSMILWYN